ncbi:transcriptional regulator, TetR family [Noviherbaspirillum humi]|uniref:Transcriptional regulator, TetR family n=1 Tax=Noviherbaspirillum humi TaxID=1688639 RepID=A0A239LVT9_9BURK|nr:TetR/AcrR family transcriptional regulator [Noviherbaspirillum humi]SNT34380.1 transcriptional regulator, TetR family [Noviherbaspirillum humi]
MARPSLKNKSSIAAAVETAERPSLRERNKAEKAHLIKAAARQLFTQKGYEATTMREVAALADVGFGTISAYATDKAGLLAMLFVEDLEHLPPLFRDVRDDATVLDQLVDAFMRLYEFWARSPELSRIVLPQMEFYNSNPFTEEIRQRRQQLQADLGDWLGRCQERKRVLPKVDTRQAAATLFAVYTSALREWIVQQPLKLSQGRERLTYLLAIPMSAIAK